MGLVRQGDARMSLPTQKTCSMAGPLCIIHSPKRFTIHLQYTLGPVGRPMVGYPQAGGRGSIARRLSDAALDAEFLLEIFNS